MATQVSGQGEGHGFDESSAPLTAAEHANIAAATTLALMQSSPVAPHGFARLLRALGPRGAARRPLRTAKGPRIPTPLSGVGVTSADWEYVSRIAHTSDPRFWASVVTGSHSGGNAPWGGRGNLAD